MKRLCLVYLLGLSSLASFAQSAFDFSNDSTSLVYTNALSVGGTRGLIAPPQVYYFGLFIAPNGTTDRSLFTFTGLYATNTSIAGRYSGGASVTVPGWPVGNTAMLQVRGWSDTLGHDWTAIAGQQSGDQWLANGFYGESTVAPFTFSGSPTPPGASSFGSFDLTAVPEPSAAALLIVLLMTLFSRHRAID
jgi:hypothetical protein